MRSYNLAYHGNLLMSLNDKEIYELRMNLASVICIRVHSNTLPVAPVAPLSPCIPCGPTSPLGPGGPGSPGSPFIPLKPGIVHRYMLKPSLPLGESGICL